MEWKEMLIQGWISALSTKPCNTMGHPKDRKDSDPDASTGSKHRCDGRSRPVTSTVPWTDGFAIPELAHQVGRQPAGASRSRKCGASATETPS
eukprot:scaffold385_cov305-Pinguiococcus_pyrenoidosus.AAC.33